MMLIDVPRNDVFAREVEALVRRHGLVGAVLIGFDGECVGVSTSGRSDEAARVMRRIGDAILADVEDGRYDASDAQG